MSLAAFLGRLGYPALIMAPCPAGVFSVAVVLAVIAVSALILLHAFRGRGQPGTVRYGCKSYDCHTVLQSFDDHGRPGVYPQSVIDACVNSRVGTQP